MSNLIRILRRAALSGIIQIKLRFQNKVKVRMYRLRGGGKRLSNVSGGYTELDAVPDFTTCAKVITNTWHQGKLGF